METILSLAIIFGIVFVVYKRLTQPTAFELLPTRAEYLNQHPECQTERGMQCCHCNSTSIKNWGLEDSRSAHRIFICNHCGEKRYRSDTVLARSKADHGASNPWLDP